MEYKKVPFFEFSPRGFSHPPQRQRIEFCSVPANSTEEKEEGTKVVRCIFALTLPFLFLQGFLRETAEISYMWEKASFPKSVFASICLGSPRQKREKTFR